MLIAEKPALDDDLLMHFGVKGMRWGKRKAFDSSGSGTSSGPAKPKMSTGKKVAIGIGVLAGAAAVATLSSKAGRTKISEMAVTSFVGRRQQKAQKSQGGVLEQFGLGKAMGTKTADIPRARGLMSGAGSAGRRNSAILKDQDDLTQKILAGNQSALIKAWNDPNHVWQL